MTTTKPINEIVDELWLRREISIPNRDNTFRVTLKDLGEEYLDIYMRGTNPDEGIGFITMQSRESGVYEIRNSLWIKMHPDCEDLLGNGIEVSPLYRGMGFGDALLSIGIGTAQRDYKSKQTDKPFEVRVNGINPDLAKKVYEPFGFVINSPNTATYTNADAVLELNLNLKLISVADRVRYLIKRLERKPGFEDKAIEVATEFSRLNDMVDRTILPFADLNNRTLMTREQYRAQLYNTMIKPYEKLVA